ncbi:MAG: hypothetical protein HOV68_33715 [Streptomycetaceae bacterium]|nr:hypothetical protein [Streptomycetaceae bacterium]
MHDTHPKGLPSGGPPPQSRLRRFLRDVAVQAVGALVAAGVVALIVLLV